jgi:Sec-independent protein secretion pathway component TatC
MSSKITIQPERVIEYEVPDGLYFNRAIITLLLSIGAVLFCCGISITYCILIRYQK